MFYKGAVQAPNAILTVYVPQMYNPYDLVKTYKEADLSDIDWRQEAYVSTTVPKKIKSGQGPVIGT